MATPDGPAAGDRVGGRRLATIYRVGEFELRADERRLLRQGQAVALGARAFDLLLCLVEHRDRLMGKDEILAQVWPGVVVEENNLTVQVSALRKLLGADAIATVAGRGYRFTMAVLAPAAAVLSGEAPELDLSLPDKPSIAVLPFINLSGDPEQEYFTDGITEDILTELSRFQTLFVIARNSSFSYKSQAIDIKQIGRELGVRYVVQGSIRKAGQRIRVTAQLVETLTGSHLWAEKYDRVLEDIFAVQEEVTECIVGAVAPHVDAAELLKARRRPGSLSAYELALRARALLLDSAPVHVVSLESEPVQWTEAGDDLVAVVIGVVLEPVDLGLEIGAGDAGAEIEAVVGGGCGGRQGEREQTEHGCRRELHVHVRPLLRWLVVRSRLETGTD